MTDRDAFADRGRSLEEEYFHRREREVIEKMRQRAAAETDRRELSAAAGVADEEILHDLHQLGYTGETVMLLYLVPLIQTAWAEGGVSQRERELIVQAARARGIAADTPADRQLIQWLDEKPSEAFFDSTLRAIRAILASRPAEERVAAQGDLLSLCTTIAAASGGIIGFRAVSEEERRILAQISEGFGKGR